MGFFPINYIINQKKMEETAKRVNSDIVDLMRNGGAVEHNFVPEQEIYFDAGYTPSETPMRFIREEWIDGKKYRVYQ